MFFVFIRNELAVVIISIIILHKNNYLNTFEEIFLTDFLVSFFHFVEDKGLCVGYYCYSYLLSVPLFFILILPLFKRSLIGRAKKAGSFKSLSWFEMEKAAKEYYKDKGFKVSMYGGGSADGGVDLVAKKGRRSILIQVKHYKSNVGVSVVREMLGVLVDRKEFNELHIISSTGFTKPALALANRHRIKLLGKKELFLD